MDTKIKNVNPFTIVKSLGKSNKTYIHLYSKVQIANGRNQRRAK